MIYLFDRAKKLQKIIPRKHIINATQTKVRNGIYQLAVEVPIFYETKQGTHYNYQKSVSKAEFAGHYDDKGRFQLYKIYSRNITANEQGEFLLFDGVHIFFDEAKAMGNIHDRRFRDSEAKAPADVAFNSIGWTVIDYDVTDRHNINFYRASVTDAWNDLISTYGVEFDYELQFDGRKIISKNIIMKKQIGRWTGQRFAYGTNVLTLTQEQDESEVYTAAVGRGRGEESGDGFGPRLEFGDIAWSKDGISKPIGQNYIELPSATAEYGFIENGVVKPRIAPEVVFEDIEDKRKLADATYYWLLENCLPKATWKTEVARIGNLKLGDTVGVLYKAADIIKRARVEKIEYNLLDPELSKLTLGDFHHFENRQMKRINAQIKRLGRDTNDRITRIKNEWNAWIDYQFTAALNEFEQNLIDQQAQIEADRENMTNLIEGTRTEFTDTLNAEITQTKEYAEQQAQEKASTVQTNLNSFKDSHQQLYDEVTGNILDIDTFLGDKSKTLAKQFAEMETGLNQSITAEAGRIDAIVTNFGDSGKSLAQFVLDVDSIETTVAKNDDWLGTYGSAAEQTIAGFEQKVWKSDIHNPNIIPFNNLTLVENRKQWLTRSFDGLSYLSEQQMIRISNYTSPHNYVQSPYVSLQAGETYTLSFTSLIGSSYNLNDLMQYTYVVYPDRDNVLLRDLMRRELIGSAYGVNIYKFTATFTAEETTDKARILIGAYVINQGQRSDLYIGEPKLELGEIATLYNNALSIFEQRADELKLAVTDSDGLASVIALSPTAIDFISDKINVTGNANINGGVTALAVDAIEGNFARLFANHLTVDVITADHLAVGTAMIDKFFATSARIDRLITKTHFVNEMHALTLNVIDLNASNIRARLLSANTIEAEWLKGGTALLDKVFASTAMFERMMTKSGFVTTLNTVTIDTDQITIRRPDGVAVINNGMATFDYTVQMTEYIRDADVVSWNGSFYQMNSSVRRHVMIGNFKHTARYLKVGLVLGMHGSSPSNSEYMYYRIESFGGPLSYTKQEKVMVFRNSNTDVTAEIDLGRPTFQRSSFYIYLVKANASDGGTNAGNIVQLRTNSAYLEG